MVLTTNRNDIARLRGGGLPLKPVLKFIYKHAAQLLMHCKYLTRLLHRNHTDSEHCLALLQQKTNIKKHHRHHHHHFSRERKEKKR